MFWHDFFSFVIYITPADLLRQPCIYPQVSFPANEYIETSTEHAALYFILLHVTFLDYPALKVIWFFLHNTPVLLCIYSAFHLSVNTLHEISPTACAQVIEKD